jgi:hypothetical protein
VYLCASRPCTDRPTDNASGSQSLLEIYALGAKAKLSTRGNTVITVPWEKRGKWSLKFNWYQKDLGNRNAIAFGTVTDPPRFLSINERGSVTLQDEEDNSVYFTRETKCSSEAVECRHSTLYVTHMVTSSSSNSSTPVETKFYLAAASNGTVYAQTKRSKRSNFIECGLEDNEKESCWWTPS